MITWGCSPVALPAQKGPMEVEPKRDIKEKAFFLLY